MDVRVEDTSARRVVYARANGAYHESAAKAWEQLCGWACPRGVMGPDAQMLGICHDDPQTTPPDQIRYDAAITVGDDVEGEGDIGVQIVPAGLYAVATHQGPYERLTETWMGLYGQWLPASGYRLRQAPAFELYRNDPQTTAPEQLLTDVYMPIERA
jgi:AraC family transcriptional regulator